MSTMIAKMMLNWLEKNHKFLLQEKVIPPGYHKHKDPPRKALRAKYPVEVSGDRAIGG